MNVETNSWSICSKMIQLGKKYGIKAMCETMASMKSSSILKIIHQFIANLMSTFGLQNNYLEKDDPWEFILAATDFK